MGKSAECSCKGKSLERFLQPTILMLLYYQEMHGFKMLQEISKTPMFEGNYPDPSGLYRYLKKMEAQGLLISREEQQEDFPSKRIYAITDLGKDCLKHWSETLESYVNNLSEFSQQLKIMV